jgi:hypothetical protein
MMKQLVEEVVRRVGQVPVLPLVLARHQDATILGLQYRKHW